MPASPYGPRLRFTGHERDVFDLEGLATHLTPEGETLAKEVRRLQDESEARLAALLPDGERERLIDLLRRLTQSIGASADED